MTTGLPRLSELIPGYPEDAPQFGDELADADPSTLPPIAHDLRRHVVTAIQANREITFKGPDEVKRRLELNHVRPVARKWVTLALDASRRRIMIASPRYGGMVAQRRVSKRVPDAAWLRDQMPLPDGGTYLMFYGGGPEVLSVEDRHGGGVAADIATLRAEVPVADVCFWKITAGEAPTLFSLTAGRGEQAGTPVDFPHPEWLAVARQQDGKTTERPVAMTNSAGAA